MTIEDAICLAAFVLFLACLPGCASKGFSGICGFQPMGESEQGVHFAKIYCEPLK